MAAIFDPNTCVNAIINPIMSIISIVHTVPLSDMASDIVSALTPKNIKTSSSDIITTSRITSHGVITVISCLASDTNMKSIATLNAINASIPALAPNIFVFWSIAKNTVKTKRKMNTGMK